MKKLVLIHGLLLSSWVFTRMRRYFIRHGYQCYQFDYPTRSKTISQIAVQLNHWLVENQLNDYTMICHSMGGIVSHAYLEQYGNNEHSPKKVICLGSPFKGSMVANNLTQSAPGRLLLGVQSDSVLVTGTQSWPFSCPLGIIAGNKNIGAGRLLGLDSKKPGDGTVLVEETGIQGATDHIVLPVSHSQMTFSTKVFLQIEHFTVNNVFKHSNP